MLWEGPSCSSCQLPGYGGICAYCRGDISALAEELVLFDPLLVYPTAEILYSDEEESYL